MTLEFHQIAMKYEALREPIGTGPVVSPSRAGGGRYSMCTASTVWPDSVNPISAGEFFESLTVTLPTVVDTVFVDEPPESEEAAHSPARPALHPERANSGASTRRG